MVDIDAFLPETSTWARSLGVSEDAVSLYRESDTIDLHLDTFIWTRLFGYDLYREHGLGPFGGRFLGQVDIPRALGGGLSGATWVITTNPFLPAPLRKRAYFRNHQRLRRLLDEHPAICVVRSAEEFRRARSSGKHGAFLGIQGGNALSLADLDRIPDGDVIRITLVHLTHSELGATSTPLPRLGRAEGLTSLGKSFVERLNEKRILVDLAHISRPGFFDALSVHDPALPPVVTHTGIDAVYPHWRNLTDAQIRALADRGGTIGIMFQASFLGRGGVDAATVVDHMAHVVELVGDDHVSLGTDYDGAIIPPADLRTPRTLPRLVDAMLSRGWDEVRIRKILAGNWLRVVAAVRDGA